MKNEASARQCVACADTVRLVPSAFVHAAGRVLHVTLNTSFRRTMPLGVCLCLDAAAIYDDTCGTTRIANCIVEDNVTDKGACGV